MVPNVDKLPTLYAICFPLFLPIYVAGIYIVVYV